jgi:hypothetical protein
MSDMVVEETLEEAYFHINNGGLTLRIFEKTEDEASSQWVCEVNMKSFGSGTTFQFPLGNPAMVVWFIQALQRTVSKMSPEGELAFHDDPPTVKHYDGHRHCP